MLFHSNIIGRLCVHFVMYRARPAVNPSLMKRRALEIAQSGAPLALRFCSVKRAAGVLA
jgi:hypothetical protein